MKIGGIISNHLCEVSFKLLLACRKNLFIVLNILEVTPSGNPILPKFCLECSEDTEDCDSKSDKITIVCMYI